MARKPYDMRAFRDKYQQESARIQARRPQSGKFEIPAWKMRMDKLRLDKEGTLVHIFAGNYEGWPFFEFWEAWIKVKGRPRQILCNCAGGSTDKNCVLCHYEREEENPAYIPKLRVAVNAIELATFHKVQRTAKSGRPYTVLEKCKGTNELGHNRCEYCDSRTPTTFGRKVFLSLGKGYWESLNGISEQISRICKNCGGKIFVLKYSCGECGEVFADPSAKTVSDEEFAMFESEKISCPNCGHTDYADKEEQCYKRGEDAKLVPSCDNTEACNLFDMPIQLGIAGDGPTSSMVLQTKEEDLKFQAMDPRVVDMAHPYDFDKFLGSMPCEEQAEIMDKPNPFEGKEDDSGDGEDVEIY